MEKSDRSPTTLHSIDDYERFLYSTIETWSPEGRTALAAAMAERWLPVYETFSKAEQWGDPANLRRCLDAVWNHLGGKLLSPNDRDRYLAQVHDSTPHMDDFDDEAALSACLMLSAALECCGTRDNINPAMQAMISGFEAVVPNWELDPEVQPRLWRQIAVRRELNKQSKLIERIGPITRFDSMVVKTLRKTLAGRTFRGAVSKASSSSKGPVTISNQTAFEQYRRIVEFDLKTSQTDWAEKEVPGSTTFVLMLCAAWMGRYTRRRDTINGDTGQLADVVAHQALVARQHVVEGREMAIPDWDLALQEMLNMTLGNTWSGFDVTAYDQPHGYGPSMRRLWLEARRQGHSVAEAWRSILAWARHDPGAWEKEDQRKAKGLVYTTSDFGAFLTRELHWDDTGDPENPWASEVDGERWTIRLNDFPDDYMYSLMIDGKSRGDFHDWPETWRRR